MMKKPVSSFLTMVLIIALVFNLLPVTSYAVFSLPYGMTSASIGVGSGSTAASATTQVGFGGVRWYVVGFNGTGINKGSSYITLLTKTVTGTSKFTASDSGTYNQYQNSLLQTAVNSLVSNFDNRETAAVVGLTLDGVAGTQPTNQKVWALSSAEASAVSSDVRAISSYCWWLRSTVGFGNPGYVFADGTFSDYGAPNSTDYSVRPGTTIDLSKVLYAAPISNAKGTTVGTMNSVDLSSEMKFTLLDNTNLGLTVTGAPASLTKGQDSTIELPFSGAHTGDEKYVSCVLVSNTDSLVKYYAKLSTEASGTLSIQIPSDVMAGSYTLLIYNEQITSGEHSDYASTPVSISLTVTGSANSAPTLKSGVPSTATASVSVNSAYNLNLANIFTDPDGNDLSYRVYLNGSATAVAASESYSFTPTAAGNTTLRFTAYDGAKESASYTVTLTATNVPVTGITVSGENGATKIGLNGSLQLHYTVEPSNATNHNVTWSVTMSCSGPFRKGEIDAGNMLRTSGVESTGTAVIKATAADGSGMYGELTLTISSNAVSGISLNASKTDVAVGDTAQMTATVSPANAAQSVTWSVPTANSVINTSGLISFGSSGSVTVRATAQDGTGIYSEMTFSVKALQSAPSAPSVYAKTADSVTLNAISGCEYSADGFSWQIGTTFSNLVPNTAYNFYARKAATGTMKESPASSALSVTTEKAVLGGTVSVTGTLHCGVTVSADTGGLTADPSCSLGTLSYQWTRGGTAITDAQAAAYTLTADDFGKVVNVTVSSSNCTGSVSSANATATTKGDPDYTVPTGLTASYGDTLDNVDLPDGFSWEDDPATSVGAIGGNSFNVTYTPENTDCYNTIYHISVTVTVGKATPVCTAPTASDITYGQTLESSSLTGGTFDVAGSFAWTDKTTLPSVADSGTTEYSVTFTPSDTAHYNTVTVKVKLTVSKATPTVTTAPTASGITYGDSLSASNLTDGETSVPGTFAWTDGTVKPAVSDSGTTAYSVTFTPTDTDNYNNTSTAVKLTVSKAATTVTKVPAASAITYGDSLSDSALTNGTGSVPGSFTWTNGAAVPAVSDSETTEFSVTFTPTDTANYNTTLTKVKLKVYGVNSTVTKAPSASDITYGQKLSASTFTGGETSVPGTFSWTNGDTVPSVSDSGVTAYSVTFTPTDANYAPSSTSVKLTVSKASTGVASAPTASAITYGQSLSASSLIGGSGSVPGAFAWTDGTVKPAVSDSGTTEYSVTFTPTDTANYETSSTTVKLTVSKATPTVTTIPTASGITYGDSLSASALTQGVGSVPGAFAWTNSATKPAVSDSNTRSYPVTFTPTDTANYNNASTAVKLTVSKATPTVTTAPTASGITYGDSLSASALTKGEGSVSGSFAWTDGTVKPAVSDSNTTEYPVTFTPTDTDNYNNASTAVKLAVSKAATTVTKVPAASAITYGDSLSDSALTNGTGSVPGSFAWTNGAAVPAVTDSETTEFSVTFTPTDTANYSSCTAKVKLKVFAAASVITAAPTASAITYGQSLSDSALSGGETSVPGAFSWTNGAVKPSASDSGVTGYSVTFTPTDANYAPSSTSVKLTVSKASTGVASAPTASAITYGQSLSASSLIGGSGSVPGAFAWTDGTVKPAVSDSGTTEYSVTFTPTDTANYETSSTTVKLTVSKATPTVTTIPTASGITYGDSLSASALTQGVGSVPGAFAWTNSATKPAVSDSNTRSYPVTFTPTDTANYNNASTAVKLTVSKATPTVTTAPTASGITYGDSLSASALTKGEGSVSGSFAWTDGTVKPAVSDSGTTEYPVTFTPADTDNYNNASTAVKLTVSKAATTVTKVPAASAITYGDSLSASALSEGTGSVPGTFAWTNGAAVPAVTDSETTEFSVTFMPTDDANYSSCTAKVKLKIFAAASVVTAAPTASAITYGQKLSDSALSGGETSVPGAFSWTNGAVKPSASDSGVTGYSVTFTPTDANYAPSSTSVKLTVSKASTGVASAPTASAITYGQSLSASSLIGGSGSVSGSFSWTDGTVKPAVSDSGTTEYSVTFTPTDANYATSTTAVTLTVSKATPVITTMPKASPILLGYSLSNSNLYDGAADTAGNFTWTDKTIQPGRDDSDKTEYSVIFTPADTANYNTITMTVKVTVYEDDEGFIPAVGVLSEVIVDGESQKAGRAVTTTGTDGRTTTTVTLDSDKLEDMLDSAEDGAEVTIPITSGSDVAAGVLTGDSVRSMQSKNAALVIQTGSVTYSLPASQIDIEAIADQLGSGVSPSDITVTVKISEPSKKEAAAVENAAKEGGFTLVVPAVSFTVTCEYKGKKVEVNSFDAYVERLIAIPDGVDPDEVTTAVIVVSESESYQVPTQIVEIDGKYYAKISSLTNSTYAVVYHPAEFSDMETHWAKDAVNDMGARMIVSGAGNNTFDPDRNMTRAEFAAIIVKALGLAPGTGNSGFADVASSAWYCGYIRTATQYGIITGYGNGAFGPLDPITREQAMTMIARAMKLTGLEAPEGGAGVIGSFTDSSAVSAFARESVEACLRAGIVSGKGGNAIAPKDNITRAEVAVMIQRLLLESDLI